MALTPQLVSFHILGWLVGWLAGWFQSVVVVVAAAASYKGRNGGSGVLDALRRFSVFLLFCVCRFRTRGLPSLVFPPRPNPLPVFSFWNYVGSDRYDFLVNERVI